MICKLCKLDLDCSNFYPHKTSKSGLNCYCKKCDNHKAKQYRERNKERISASKKLKYNSEKSIVIERVKNYKNKNDFKIKCYKKKYYQKNKKKLIEQARVYCFNKRRTDPLFKLKMNLRSRLLKIIKGTILKSKKTEIYLGCTFFELKKHIESLFKDGMSWENQGKWHVDHIIPLSTASTEEDLYKLCHYTNLQPLWAEDNLKKSDKI